jgi:hypothetical protein
MLVDGYPPSTSSFFLWSESPEILVKYMGNTSLQYIRMLRGVGPTCTVPYIMYCTWCSHWTNQNQIGYFAFYQSTSNYISGCHIHYVVKFWRVFFHCLWRIFPPFWYERCNCTLLKGCLATYLSNRPGAYRYRASGSLDRSSSSATVR